MLIRLQRVPSRIILVCCRGLAILLSCSLQVPSKKMEGNKSTQCDTALATVSAWLAGARIEFKRLVEKDISDQVALSSIGEELNMFGQEWRDAIKRAVQAQKEKPKPDPHVRTQEHKDDQKDKIAELQMYINGLEARLTNLEVDLDADHRDGGDEEPRSIHRNKAKKGRKANKASKIQGEIPLDTNPVVDGDVSVKQEGHTRASTKMKATENTEVCSMVPNGKEKVLQIRKTKKVKEILQYSFVAVRPDPQDSQDRFWLAHVLREGPKTLYIRWLERVDELSVSSHAQRGVPSKSRAVNQKLKFPLRYEYGINTDEISKGAVMQYDVDVEEDGEDFLLHHDVVECE